MADFDVVVIGSGFGGGVTACRAAEAGLHVCVLERGRPYPPGSFPRTANGMQRNFWDPSAGLYGMFDVWSFRGLEGLVSSGLGGGSLIYANVLLRKDEKWFVKDGKAGEGHEHWPLDRQELNPYYDRAEAVLGAVPYPFDRKPYSDTAKTRAMQSAAKDLGLDWQLPPLAVTFAGPGQEPGEPIPGSSANYHGRTRHTCQLCGECDAGCNYGSKNSIDFTYITLAQRHGADIRPLSEACEIVPLPGGGYEITYIMHSLEREGRKVDGETLPTRTVTARAVVVAAGTFGTTYLLLKNRDKLGDMPALGTRFCGNGDLLTFGLLCREADGGCRTMDASRGPVITSAIRGADALDGNGATGRGFYIEDAGYPAFISFLVEMSNTPGVLARTLRVAARRLLALLRSDRRSQLSAQVSALIGDCALSSSSIPLLGMGRDLPDGRMTLADGWLDIDWRVKNSEPYFRRVRDTMRQLVHAWGGRFHDNPLWFMRRVIAVHPLGGCPMGRHAAEGVVNADGEVFNNPGLYVADGAVMPGPVGANPSLTIAAIAERTAERMVASLRGPAR